jgi:hypothetical protein
VILATRNIRARCPIRWKHRHVKGHQDDNHSIFLDRWALLDIDMDLAAKVHWHRHAEHRHRPAWKIYGEPWSLWIGPRKLCRNLRDQITDFILGTKAKEYWDSRNCFGQATSADVDWEACGQAMASASTTTRHWIVKHTAGICGSGKMMKVWKQRSSSKCPRCEAPVEDAAHIWRYPQREANAVWEQSIDGLREWMIKQKTHLAIRFRFIIYERLPA